MTIVRALACLALPLAAACSAPGGPYPSLQPRAAESVDPRVPVERPLNDRPANAALLTRLEALVAQARAGEAAFLPAIAEARRLSAGAGSRGSEGWIAAQQALSAAIDARRPTALAVGDTDSLAAELLASQGGIAPREFKAIEEAAAIVAAIDRRQSGEIAAVQTSLGL